MRILHLIASEGLYGAARVVIELSKALKKVHNCQPIVGVITNSYNTDVAIIDEAKANDIDVVIFHSNRQLSLKTVLSIKKYIKTENIHLVHCHGYKSNFYGLISSSNKIPKVATNHNWLISHWKLKLYCLLDALWIRYFDRIVAVSDEIKREMLKYRIPEKKIEVVDNGIDLGRFNKDISTKEIKREFNINDDNKIVGTIGSLRYEKGHIYLLRAAKEIIENHKYVKFMIIGDGPLRKYLANEIINLGIKDNVIFTGYRKDIPEMLSVFDIFVLPSIKEGLPLVLLEAMAAGKPVIASKVGAVPKIIKNNKNGILIKSKSIPELKSAIDFILDNKEKVERLTTEGYVTVKKEFSSEIMCEKYLNLYKELTL